MFIEVRRKLPILLEQIRFEHTTFALPFAYLGMVLAARGLPTLWQIVWITMAMVAARTYAMSMNRLLDWREDLQNPRTRGRPLPQGRLRPREVALFSLLSLGSMFFAAAMLNWLCVLLAPIAALVLGGYTLLKRRTWLYPFAIGIGDGGAPIGGWAAVTGELAWEPVLLGLAVTVWVAGFDLIYTCQDYEFDQRAGIPSVASCFGIAAALAASSWCHIVMVTLLAAVGVAAGLGVVYWVGLALVTALLIYEHRLVSPTDLSRLNLAFFNANGYIAVILFISTVGGLHL